MQALKIPPLLSRREDRGTGEACLRVWMSHASLSTVYAQNPLPGGFRRTIGSELFAGGGCGGCGFESVGFFFFFAFFLVLLEPIRALLQAN